MSTLPPDLHIHTALCGHAKGTMKETVREAIKKGLSCIGFADHFSYPAGHVESVPDCVIPRDKIDEYWDEIDTLQKQFQDQITILKATEVDYLPDYTSVQVDELSQVSLDYVIGSIHLLDEWPVDYKPEFTQKVVQHFGGIANLWKRYWSAMEAMLQQDYFQIAGHLDIPRKHIGDLDFKNQKSRIEYCLTIIKERDLAIEINMGGKDRAVDNKPYPSLPILELASDIGVDISIGSDAHAPEQVGRYFEEGISLLKSVGYESVVFFKNKEKQFVLI